MIDVLAQSGIEDAVTGAAGIPVAFAVGMVSFFSPCVLPLVPGYLSYISGVSAQDLESGQKRGRLSAAMVLFVLGFTIVFTAVGAGVGAFASFVSDNEILLLRISGALVLLLGLGFLATGTVSLLQRWASEKGLRRIVGRAGVALARVFGSERGLHPRVDAGLAGALPLGAAFAIGWTPCVGPGLGAIFSIAVPERSPARGAILLLAFSLGFGLWFVLAGLAFRRASRAFDAVKRHLRMMVLAGGTLMVTIGLLMLAGYWDDVLAPLRRLIRGFAPPI